MLTHHAYYNIRRSPSDSNLAMPTELKSSQKTPPFPAIFARIPSIDINDNNASLGSEWPKPTATTSTSVLSPTPATYRKFLLHNGSQEMLQTEVFINGGDPETTSAERRHSVVDDPHHQRFFISNTVGNNTEDEPNSGQYSIPGPAPIAFVTCVFSNNCFTSGDATRSRHKPNASMVQPHDGHREAPEFMSRANTRSQSRETSGCVENRDQQESRDHMSPSDRGLGTSSKRDRRQAFASTLDLKSCCFGIFRTKWWRSKASDIRHNFQRITSGPKWRLRQLRRNLRHGMFQRRARCLRGRAAPFISA